MVAVRLECCSAVAVLMKTPIDIYAEEHTMHALKRVYRHIFERDRNVPQQEIDLDIVQKAAKKLQGWRNYPSTQ